MAGFCMSSWEILIGTRQCNVNQPNLALGGPKVVLDTSLPTLDRANRFGYPNTPQRQKSASQGADANRSVGQNNRRRRIAASAARPAPNKARLAGSGTLFDGGVGSKLSVVRMPKVKACQYSLLGMVHEKVE